MRWVALAISGFALLVLATLVLGALLPVGVGTSGEGMITELLNFPPIEEDEALVAMNQGEVSAVTFSHY
jgi:hypothetical protein